MLMRSFITKRVIFVSVLVLGLSVSGSAQDTTSCSNMSEKHPWFVVLPLRFTHLQNHTTMLSGIKAGRKINSGLSAAISIYHSFYLSSFKARANLSGFESQPQLFINCVGMETQYDVYSGNFFTINLQLLTGWGFLKYDLREHDFRSKQVNYLALEPSVNMEFCIGRLSTVGLGAGYRPLLSRRAISYTSAISSGAIAVDKSFPNGLNVFLTIKGYL